MSGVKTGVVVLGHGSRASFSEANQVVFAIADLMKVKLGHDLVEPAILTAESGQQNLSNAVDILFKKGANGIVVAPMFFAAGSHMRFDIPNEIGCISKKYPGVRIVLSKHIGADSRVAEILCDRVKQTLLIYADKE